MRILVALALVLLALPGAALAAPPANDNRANAEPIPAFPHTVSATTAEATVERLDPQVSRCGRIESTLWYRLDTAPDGLIGITVKAGAGVAPVLAHLSARRIDDPGSRLRVRRAGRHRLGFARGGSRLELPRAGRSAAGHGGRLVRAASGAVPAACERRPKWSSGRQAPGFDPRHHARSNRRRVRARTVPAGQWHCLVQSCEPPRREDPSSSHGRRTARRGSRRPRARPLTDRARGMRRHRPARARDGVALPLARARPI